jgi:hypothetical protein
MMDFLGCDALKMEAVFSSETLVPTGIFATRPGRLPTSSEQQGIVFPERDAGHSSASGAEVKNATTTPLYIFLVWCLVTGTTLLLVHAIFVIVATSKNLDH